MTATSIDNCVSRPTRAALFAAGLVFAALALLAAIWPDVIALRFRPLVKPVQSLNAARQVVHSLSAPLLFMGLGFVATAVHWQALGRRGTVLVPLAVVFSYLSLQWPLRHWIIDDAAITFAYSENFVRGHGLVLHPNHPPEEAYSNTAWMLMLAAARWLGANIDTAAKLLCVLFGSLCAWYSMRVVVATFGSRTRWPGLAACALVVLGAPFVVWSGSGLEHALQALLFLAIVSIAVTCARPEWPTALCLCLLVLLRPETPLIAVATFAVYVLDRGMRDRASLVALWPMAAMPAATIAVLVAFRLSYFGDALPNPYYAKASSATFLRLFNFMGGGWGYIFDWLAQSGMYLALPVLMLGLRRRATLPIKLAAALVSAQLCFVLYAGGDWMGAFRFIAPVLPLVAILLAAALASIESTLGPRRVDAVAALLGWILLVNSAASLHRFVADPTTPTAVVAAIGKEFVKLGQRLSIAQPTLAHHDAGGTSWAAGIDLIDLAGLGNRAIAKNRQNPEFMRQYLLVERKPTFVFGSTNTFAAGATRFHLMPEFEAQYVPVRFPGRSYMQSGLCHIRRDVLRDVEGVRRVERDGKLIEVVVD